MPRKATAKEKASPQTEVATRPKRQGVKQDAGVPLPASGERRSRRSSTAAQTAASVAEATRVTRSSHGSNRANSSDRKSTSRETSLEPAEVRSSRRIIKKINYQESEGDDEESQAKKVEKEVEEEDYNAEEDVENDSDSGDTKRNKAAKGKIRSPPSRTRGRPQRAQTPKEETPTKTSPRGRRQKSDSSKGENEADFVAPTRRGRYEEEPQEEEMSAGRARSSNRPTRAARQTTTPKTTPQRPTRTSRRQQNLAKAKEEKLEDEEEEEEEENEDAKKTTEEENASDEEDETMEKSKKTGQTPPRKRKADEDPQSRKRQKTEEAKSEEKEVQDDDEEKEDSEEPMDVDESDVDSQASAAPGEPTDKKLEAKQVADSPIKDDTKIEEAKEADKDEEPQVVALTTKCADQTVSKSGDSEEKREKENVKSSPVKPQMVEECKPLASSVTPPALAKTDEKVVGKDAAKEQPISLLREAKKPTIVENQKKDLPEEKKPSNVVELEVKAVVSSPTQEKAEHSVTIETDAKPKESQQNSVNKTTDSIKCPTFNGCEATLEKTVVDSTAVPATQDQSKNLMPSVHSTPSENLSNSLCPITTNAEKDSESVLGANGVHCNQNLDSKPQSRKYVTNNSVKEDERLLCKDRTFGFVSFNMSGDSMQATKSLLEVISHQNGIVCLQDVNEEFYRSHFKSSFESQGYKVVFHIPVGHKSGFATLYKAAIFCLKQQKGFSLKDVITKDMEASFSSPEEKTAVNCHLKNCGHALVTHFTFKDRPLTVANALIPPTDLASHTVQMSCLARETLNFLGDTNKSLLICGTFNVQEDNAPYQVLRDGYLGNDMIELLQNRKDVAVPGKESLALVNLLWKSFQHSASSLESCYATVMGSELKVRGQNATLPDLMWYSSNFLKMLGVLADVESPEQASGAHLLLKADLAFSK